MSVIANKSDSVNMSDDVNKSDSVHRDDEDKSAGGSETVDGKENDEGTEGMVRRMCRMMLRRISFWGSSLIKHTLGVIGQVVQCVRFARLVHLASNLTMCFLFSARV